MDPEIDRLLTRYANRPGLSTTVSGPHPFAEIEPGLTALRRRVYAEEMPHLLDGPVLDLERRLDLDARTDHFCARTGDGAVVGAIRVGAQAMELPALSPRCAAIAEQYARYAEITRVIIHPDHRRQDLPARMFAGVVRMLLEGGRTDGLIGVCREHVLPFYEPFGLVPLHDDLLAVAARPHADYRVIACTFDRMLELGAERLLSVEAAGAPAG